MWIALRCSCVCRFLQGCKFHIMLHRWCVWRRTTKLLLWFPLSYLWRLLQGCHWNMSSNWYVRNCKCASTMQRVCCTIYTKLMGTAHIFRTVYWDFMVLPIGKLCMQIYATGIIVMLGLCEVTWVWFFTGFVVLYRGHYNLCNHNYQCIYQCHPFTLVPSFYLYFAWWLHGWKA